MKSDNAFDSKNVTYGFEIEGVFTKELIDELLIYSSQENINVNTKGDGSVNWSGLSRQCIEITANAPHNSTELNIGIFNSRKKMLDCLDMFRNGKNYFCDNSCGLHIHLGLKNSVSGDKLANYTSYKAVHELQKACSENEILKARLSNHFCKQFGRFDAFQKEWVCSSKYRIINNHYQGTIEMRVFSPQILPEERHIQLEKILSAFVKNHLHPFKHKCRKTFKKELAPQEYSNNYKIKRPPYEYVYNYQRNEIKQCLVDIVPQLRHFGRSYYESGR
jgi:hypothetical protein